MLIKKRKIIEFVFELCLIMSTLPFIYAHRCIAPITHRPYQYRITYHYIISNSWMLLTRIQYYFHSHNECSETVCLHTVT